MVEFDPNHGREGIRRQPPPIGLMDIADAKQAEEFVMKMRLERWATIRPLDSAVAYARMDIADSLYEISPTLNPDYTDDEWQKAMQTIELILEARDRITPTDLGHLGRASDLWADEMSEQLKQLREREEQIGRNNVVGFPSDRT